MLKIISGGQTGADIAAIDAAIDNNIPCGGWIPKGRKCEKGIIPTQYDAFKEHASSQYPPRTEANIKFADATIIFYQGKLTGGTLLTAQLANKHSKPHIIIKHNERDIQKVAKWILDNEFSVINVAGPRESKNPGTYESVKSFMDAVLKLCLNSQQGMIE